MLFIEFHLSYFPHYVKTYFNKTIKVDVGNDEDNLIQILGKSSYVRA